MADNGEKKYQKTLEGIQYLIGDNKHLREELREFARSAEQDRRRADEDRRRSDERFQKLMEKSDERFGVLLDQVKRTNRVAVGVARDLRAQQKQLLDGQEQTNRLLGAMQERLLDALKAILKRLPPGPNGK